MADVVRLAPDPRGRAAAPPQVAPARVVAPSSPAENDEAEDSASGFVAAGVDRRELRKLRRGEHTPGGRLDLHGKTAVEAIASVKRFIEKSHHLHRCICIVHGRGLHSEGNVAILKVRVREFLRRHRAVLAYLDAPTADGGAGAVYVLLRK